MVKPSPVKPFGLSSERVAFTNLHTGDKTSLRHIALSEYHLPCVGLGLIRVVIKVTDHAVQLAATG